MVLKLTIFLRAYCCPINDQTQMLLPAIGNAANNYGQQASAFIGDPAHIHAVQATAVQAVGYASQAATQVQYVSDQTALLLNQVRVARFLFVYLKTVHRTFAVYVCWIYAQGTNLASTQLNAMSAEQFVGVVGYAAESYATHSTDRDAELAKKFDRKD